MEIKDHEEAKNEKDDFVIFFRKIKKQNISKKMIIFKAQLHKLTQIEICNNGGIDDILKYINSNHCNDYNQNKVEAADEIPGSSKKAAKSTKKNKNKRKNSDDVLVDKFLKNLNNQSIPKDKVVKIKSNLNVNWINEIKKA